MTDGQAQTGTARDISRAERTVLLLVTAAALGIVAYVAFVNSFDHLTQWAIANGESPQRAARFPWSVDCLMVAATTMLYLDHRLGRPRVDRSAAVALGAGGALSFTANVAHDWTSPIAAVIISGWAPVAAGGTIHLMMLLSVRLFQRARSQSDVTTVPARAAAADTAQDTTQGTRPMHHTMTGPGPLTADQTNTVKPGHADMRPAAPPYPVEPRTDRSESGPRSAQQTLTATSGLATGGSNGQPSPAPTQMVATGQARPDNTPTPRLDPQAGPGEPLVSDRGPHPTKPAGAASHHSGGQANGPSGQANGQAGGQINGQARAKAPPRAAGSHSDNEAVERIRALDAEAGEPVARRAIQAELGCGASRADRLARLARTSPVDEAHPVALARAG